jgi:WG containing repeat
VQLPIEYDSVGAFSAGYAPVLQKGLYGYTTRLGKVYIPVSYEAAKPFIQAQAAVKKNGKWGMIDTKNQMIVPFEFDQIEANDKNTLWVLSKDGKYELFPVGTKRYVAAQAYDNVYLNDSATVIRVVRNGRYYFYNTLTNELAFSTAFEEAQSLYEGFAIVKQLEKYGVVNDKGLLVVPAQYDQLVAMTNTKQKEWLVKKNGVWGLRNDSKEIWPETYEWVYPSGNGLFKVKKEGKFGVVNYTRQNQGEISYDTISTSNPEFPAVVGKSGKKGLLQSNGVLITPAKYDSIVYCGASQFKAYSGKTISLIKPSGEALKTKWKELGYWNDGLISFQVKDKWGFSNSSMEELIIPTFDAVGFFYKGLAPATLNGKTGVINKSGKWIVEADYSGFRQDVSSKVIILMKDGKQYAVSERGKVLLVESGKL